jgi:hypothetical protein
MPSNPLAIFASGQRYAQYFIHKLLTRRIEEARDGLHEVQQEIADREAAARWDEEFYATQEIPTGPLRERKDQNYKEGK